MAGLSPQHKACFLIVDHGPNQGSGGFGTFVNLVQKVTLPLTDQGTAGGMWKLIATWIGNLMIASESYTASLRNY